MISPLLFCIIVINIITFVIYGIDKLKAKNGKWRIPESFLLLLVIVGGGVGAWCGVKIWRHKTLHKKFRYGIPLILIAQATACIALFGNHMHEMLGV